MHAALDAIATEDPFGIKVQIERGATYVSMQVDFNANSDPIELASAASLSIANISIAERSSDGLVQIEQVRRVFVSFYRSRRGMGKRVFRCGP